MRTIAIIGAGFSGTLLAIHLLRQRATPVRILLFERHGEFGRGLAFSTGNPRHVLNIPAGRMSGFAGRPNDFVEWLAERYDDRAEPNEFVSRAEFGAYLQDLLNRATREAGGRRLTLINDEVTAVADEAPTREVVTAKGRRYPVDRLVLAVGNLVPERPPLFPERLTGDRHYVSDPWSHAWLDALTGDERILLFGTGLTSVDVVLSLLQREHRGKITALSRRGLLPRVHAATTQGATPVAFEPPLTIRHLTRQLRVAIEAEEGRGGDWRSVIDGLRPQAQELWQKLATAEKARFLRHLRPWWDVHRHRMASQVQTRIARARETGQLEIAAGHIVSLRGDDGIFKVAYRQRHRGTNVIVTADRFVNASGVGTNFADSDLPLIRHLVEKGLLTSDELAIGPQIAPDDSLITHQGSRSDWIFGVGPITRSRYWEITAVPDIRLQVEQLAARLLAPDVLAPSLAKKADKSGTANLIIAGRHPRHSSAKS